MAVFSILRRPAKTPIGICAQERSAGRTDLRDCCLPAYVELRTTADNPCHEMKRQQTPRAGHGVWEPVDASATGRIAVARDTLWYLISSWNFQLSLRCRGGAFACVNRYQRAAF